MIRRKAGVKVNYLLPAHNKSDDDIKG